MKVIIIEDEIPAAEKLERLLKEIQPETEIVGKAGSVKKAVELFQNSQDFDVVFMDIQLTDGKSFEIFNQVEINKPIIFLTAFDQFAIDAFKVNGVDYLLKPLTYDALEASLQKLERFRGQFESGGSDMAQLSEMLAKISGSGASYKTRFMVKVGEHIRSIQTSDTALFYADGRTAYLITNNKDKYVVDYKLESLEEILDPKEFLRVNRTFIININAIKDVLIYSNSRLRITPIVDLDKEIIVSREKVSTFKDWYGGE
ncbi:MAG: LytTR family DNA-binding domain-containing protein [Cyclobacteriaceae bacterium]